MSQEVVNKKSGARMSHTGKKGCSTLFESKKVAMECIRDTGLSFAEFKKYRIYKAAFGWNVVCPCGSWLEKAMTWEDARALFQDLLRRGVC